MKQHEINRKKDILRKRNEENKISKQLGRKQKRESIIVDFDLGRYFELATCDKKIVNGLNLHEMKTEVLEDYKGDFEFIGSILIGDIEQKTKNRDINIDDFEN